MTIALFDPSSPLLPLREELRAAVDRVLDSGHFILGPEVDAFESEFAAHLGAKHAIGVANGTEAITIALRALGVGPGDEVVVPSFSFYASAEAIPPTGATPVFCDIDPDTFCVTPETVAAAVTARTKAVIAVHLFGNVAPVRAIGDRVGLPVLEDCAQSVGSTGPDGRPGTLGAIGTFSFYPSKNLGAFGDGGAITTPDADLAERVRTLRFHGSSDKISYSEVGYNSRLDELQAAVLRVQLPHVDAWAAHRAQVGDWYAEDLGDLVVTPAPTPGSRPAWHLYVIRHDRSDELAAHLTASGVGCRPYYREPIDAQQAMAPYPRTVELPATDIAARDHLAIPVSAALTREQAAVVTDAIKAFASP